MVISACGILMNKRSLIRNIPDSMVPIMSFRLGSEGFARGLNGLGSSLLLVDQKLRHEWRQAHFPSSIIYMINIHNWK